MVKLFTVLFDYGLALTMMQAAGYFASEKAKVPVLLIVTALPTVLINGACGVSAIRFMSASSF